MLKSSIIFEPFVSDTSQSKNKYVHYHLLGSIWKNNFNIFQLIKFSIKFNLFFP